MDYFRSPQLAARVEELMAEHHVPGLALAIVHHDRIASAGYGHACLHPPTPCTPDTLFDIASASKSLTAAAVALLVDDDQSYPEVQYTTPMSHLLPDDFVMPDDGYTQGVTVEDVLSHRTGMPGHDLSYMSPRASQPDDARSVTRNLRNLPVAAPIRSKYMYCNMMYTVATHLVEQKTGQRFANYLEDRFFRPLGMTSTTLQPQRARDRGLGDRIAMGYSWQADDQNYHGFPSPDCPEAQGAGSILTSVNDYIKWVQAMIGRHGPITDTVYKGLILPRIITDPTSEHLDPLTSPTLYAAGWEVRYYRGHLIVSHDGAISGFGTTHFFLPEYNFGGVIFGNSEAGNPVADILARELVDEVLQVPAGDRPDWNSIVFAEWTRSDDPGEEELRQKLCPDAEQSQPQELPLSAYTGEYQHPGYHTLTVAVKDDQLFIDATDRSFGFTLTLDHVCDQSKYIAHLSDFQEGGDVPFLAEFELENDRAVRLGLDLEVDLEGLVWFDRV
ncbi:beta-lactamase family protein [Aspergillus ibericus CBS 121593]|uniref:Beta-lactamase family protein n=1 Tax=Aspergillus ibericus CBS 121593 TaxID=1448316 RepID=A0A395H057_9EURO|nr:beta-lactamase family protein [Aspergillus ibericus CBS 121593]RAL01227.1 beta-lactamase family protein [Aspergillus ibericus CBS 121593]